MNTLSESRAFYLGDNKDVEIKNKNTYLDLGQEYSFFIFRLCFAMFCNRNYTLDRVAKMQTEFFFIKIEL